MLFMPTVWAIQFSLDCPFIIFKENRKTMALTYRGLTAEFNRHIVTDSEVDQHLHRLQQQTPDSGRGEGWGCDSEMSS